MKKHYDKLIRDKIVDILKEKNVSYEITEASEGERLEYLKKKIIEEAEEVVSSTEEEGVSELADLLEVIEYYAKELGVSMDELKNVQEQKRDKRGAFDKFYILKWTEE